MKRIIVLILLLIASPSFAQWQEARTGQGYSGAVVATAPSCTGATIQQSETAENGEVNLGAASSVDWRATQFSYSGTTGTLCRIDFNINCTTTDCTALAQAHFYENNAVPDPDIPGNLIASCTGKYDSTPLDTTNTWISLTGCSGTITNGTLYWVALENETYHATDYFKLTYDSACATELNAYSGDGSSWTATADAWCYSFKLYILE